MRYVSEQLDCNQTTVEPYRHAIYSQMSAERKCEYQKYMNTHEALGIIGECPNLDHPPQSWCLPHHGVWQQKKLGVVHDGSFENPSLNERLSTGPNLLQKYQFAIQYPNCGRYRKGFSTALCSQGRYRLS